MHFVALDHVGLRLVGLRSHVVWNCRSLVVVLVVEYVTFT